MTVEMIASQVSIQFVVVHVTLIAKLAEGMTLMALVVDVAFSAVHGQPRSGVTTPLVRKYLYQRTENRINYQWIKG